MTARNFAPLETRRRFDRGARDDERFGHDIGRCEEPSKPVKFRAKYNSGYCTRCRQPIGQGTTITRSTSGDGFTHVRCPKQAAS